MKHIIANGWFWLVALIGCIEPYDFNVENELPILVIESYLSNVSFDESLDFPSDGRYFYVNLHYSSDVKTVRDKGVDGAKVTLLDNEGNLLKFEGTGMGHYLLYNESFKAESDKEYQLKVVVDNETTYVSSWEKMAVKNTHTVGDITFKEVERPTIKHVGEEEVIRLVKGIEVFTNLPTNGMNEQVYYKWQFEPTWIYVAPLAPSTQIDKVCWATNLNYMSGYSLQQDETGGYKKDLFYMEIEQNERVYEQFSMLIKQQIISKDHFYFWNLMKEQAVVSGLFDNPPANLPTNFSCTTDESKSAIGYFGIINESAIRWYFSIKDLSYRYQNNLVELCRINYGPPAIGDPKPCEHCLDYTNGTAVLNKPNWWKSD